MSKDHFQLTAVEASAPYKLHLTFADGKLFEVDLQPWITSTQALHPLKNTGLFAKAARGLGGRSVDWAVDADPESKAIELDLGADNLRNLAIEQAGGIGHERIWMKSRCGPNDVSAVNYCVLPAAPAAN